MEENVVKTGIPVSKTPQQLKAKKENIYIYIIENKFY
tara:strand:- start:929 stop:1039 length:111 start_codon:yes stop_codon:yes gene_type:complete